MKVIMVRHGETHANIGGIYSGWTDYPLTEEGLEQVKKSKYLLMNKKIDVIYSSPSKRALITAKEIASSHGLEVEINDNLREMNFGIFEGKTAKEIEKLYKIEWENWNKDYVNYKIPEGECLLDLYERIKMFFEEIKHNNKTYLLVTHDGFIKVALTYLLNLEINTLWSFKTLPGCIVEVEYNDGFGLLSGLINI